MANELKPILLNGIRASTGQPSLPPLTARDLANIARDRPLDKKTANLIKEQALRRKQKVAGSRSVEFGVDDNNLSQAGWGVIFAQGDEARTPALREALKPLLDLRKQIAGDLYREYVGPKGFRADDTPTTLLSRAKTRLADVVKPKKFPLYVLIIGDPQKIPFSFQYMLDTQYFVGRLHFEGKDEQETLAMYARYAQSVADAEKGVLPKLPKRVSLFGPSVRGDASEESYNGLLKPLLADLAQTPPLADAGWNIDSAAVGAQATKANLSARLGGPDTPALLLTATHGVDFDNGAPQQLSHQGALLCADWAGPTRGPLKDSDYFWAGDVAGNGARLNGAITFHFACYSAGTPQFDDFSHALPGPPEPIAPRPFIAALPQQLLSSSGGALAVVGHVERALSYSFMSDVAGPQIDTFAQAFRELMAGRTIGSAVHDFNQRFSILGNELTEMLDQIKKGRPEQPDQLAQTWTERNDARNYVVLGDPAVRLNI